MFRIEPLTRLDLMEMRSMPIKRTIKEKVNGYYERGDTRNLDVLSTLPYGREDIDSEFKASHLFVACTHIDLPIPIASVFLAGKELRVINKVIKPILSPQEKKKYKEDLANGRTTELPDASSLGRGATILIKDDVTGKYKVHKPNTWETTLAYDKNKHLIGGDALLYLMKHVDVIDQIKRLLYNEIYILTDKMIHSPDEIYEYRTNKPESEDYVWVIDDFYWKHGCDVSDSSPIQYKSLKLLMKRLRKKLILNVDPYFNSDESDVDNDDYDEEDIMEQALNYDGGGGRGSFISHIAILLSFRRDPRVFYNMVQDFVVVTPIGYRPSIGKMYDPLSILFDRLVSASNILTNSTMIETRLETVRSNYVNMHQVYLQLTHTKRSYDDDRYKPLIKLLTGKYGVIRKNVEGTINDFTGRSVITVDPYMSVDSIGIPEEMALSLAELDVVRRFKDPNGDRIKVLLHKNKPIAIDIARKFIHGKYIIAGRQPTLWRHGLQAFKIVVTTNKSITLNPLITKAYNADFDGDQMHVNMPQTTAARDETARLLSNMKNLFFDRDGSPMISPRMEMLYGYYVCFNAKADELSRHHEFATEAQFRSCIYDGLKDQTYLITDTCSIAGVEYRTIGYACLKCSLFGIPGIKDFVYGQVPLTKDKSKPEKYSKDFYDALMAFVFTEYTEERQIVNILNNLTVLGFTVASLYAPDLSILNEYDHNQSISRMKKEFFEKIKEREEWYNLGFDTDESYQLYYTEQVEELEKKIDAELQSRLSDDANGFYELMKSGARGSKLNLRQMFGMKGLIMKNQVEAFTTVIPTSMSQQLTPTEHFLTTFGMRENTIDKSIGTYRPGYMGRKLSHVARHTVITNEDCGTSKGIMLRYDLLKEDLREKITGVDVVDYYTIKDFVCNMLVGRYIVDKDNLDPLTRVGAEALFEARIASIVDGTVQVYKGIKMRSPITCDNPCCIKCYGVDLGTNKEVVVGRPVGFIAAEAISEVLTQMIMKNFQTGGIAGVKNLTSQFDIISDLFEMNKVTKGNLTTTPIVHDFITPVSGYIRTRPLGDGTSELNICDEEGKNKLRKKIIVYDNVKLKEYVNAKESINLNPGTLDVNEILSIRGIDSAWRYILFKVYSIYLDNTPANCKHFEVVISNMIMYACTATSNPDKFTVGNFYSNKEVKEYLNDKDYEFMRVLRGVKNIPKVRNNFFTALSLENVNAVVTRNIVTSAKDDLSDPFVRCMLGLPINIGTAYPTYLDSLGGNI